MGKRIYLDNLFIVIIIIIIIIVIIIIIIIIKTYFYFQTRMWAARWWLASLVILEPTNSLSVFDHFEVLALKGLNACFLPNFFSFCNWKSFNSTAGLN